MIFLLFLASLPQKTLRIHLRGLVDAALATSHHVAEVMCEVSLFELTPSHRKVRSPSLVDERTKNRDDWVDRWDVDRAFADLGSYSLPLTHGVLDWSLVYVALPLYFP